MSILWGHRSTRAAARWARSSFALSCGTLHRPVRSQGFVQKDLRCPRVNVFLAVQGLSSDQKRRVPPSSSFTRQKSPTSSKTGTFTALHRNFCRETAHGRMVLPSVFPAASLFPRPFLKGCSSWAAGKGLCTIPAASCAAGGWDWAGSWHTAGSLLLFGNTQPGDAARATGIWGTLHIAGDAAAKRLLWL